MLVYYFKCEKHFNSMSFFLLRTYPKTDVALAAPPMKSASPQTVCGEKGHSRISARVKEQRCTDCSSATIMETFPGSGKSNNRFLTLEKKKKREISQTENILYFLLCAHC